MQTPLKERYRLYREHKFLRAILTHLENQLAIADFTDSKQVIEIQTKLEEIFSIMENHAKHENEVIHPLLSAKGSKLIDEFEIDHKNYVAIFEDLKSRMQDLISITDESELIRKSYEFYIAYRQFLAMDLLHINKEELIIMPALQEYYSDEELKKNIDFPIYAQMSSEDMIEMMHILFPYMNVDDKEHFLHDIKEAQPEKFTKAWQGISPSINRIERDQLVKKLKLDMIIKVETTH